MQTFAHVGFAVRDIEKSKVFYEKALAPLGLSLLSAKLDSVHFGKDGRTLVWIHTRGPVPGPIHISFEAERMSQVRLFYEAGLAAGGKDNGAPGIREDYSPTYYAAFVLDPDGNNVEAICRTKQD